MTQDKHGYGDQLSTLIAKSLAKKTSIQPLLNKIEKQDRQTVTALLQALGIENKLIFDELREALSVIRDFAAKDYFSVEDPNTGSMYPYIDMAIACRNAMVKILNCGRNDVHCTIKYCTGKKGKATRRIKVWTFARSDEQSGRLMTLGPQKKIPVYKNSSFSSIIGCKDVQKNAWKCRPHQCFSCNNLTKVHNYADSKKNWSSYYKSAIVFPLRYRKQDLGPPIDCIIGFLTFDSLIEDAFKDIPCRFEFIGRPDEYLAAFKKTDVYHVGHSIADAIAMAAILADNLTEKDIVQIQGDD